MRQRGLWPAERCTSEAPSATMRVSSSSRAGWALRGAGPAASARIFQAPVAERVESTSLKKPPSMARVWTSTPGTCWRTAEMTAELGSSTRPTVSWLPSILRGSTRCRCTSSSGSRATVSGLGRPWRAS